MRMLRYHHYGASVNSHDLSKFVALLLMFVDHLGLYFYPHLIALRVIGRLAAPVFFFLVGFSGSYRFKPPILFYGLGLTLLYSLVWKGHVYINVLVNFTLIKLLLDHYDPDKSHGVNLIIFYLLFAFGAIFTIEHLEYGTLGVLFAIAGRLCAKRNAHAQAWLIATVVAYISVQMIAFRLFELGYLLPIWGVGILLIFYFWFYRLREYPIEGAENAVIRFFSRYSLEVYSLHLLAIFVVKLIGQHHSVFF